MWAQLPRDRSPSSIRILVPRFNVDVIDKKYPARTDADIAYELGTDQYSMSSSSNNGKCNTDSENPCIYVGLINYICEIWQLRKISREKIVSNQPIRSTLNNISTRMIRLI